MLLCCEMAKQKHSWKDIKKVLAEFSSKQLLELAQDLYKFSSENKSFFHTRFLDSKDGKVDLAPYKKRIQKAISPESGRYSLSKGRQAINEFKKATGNIHDTLELMLYYVHCGNNFTLELGDIDEPFYNSMESMFDSMVKKLIQTKDNDLMVEFLEKMEKEYNRVDGIVGWWYPDSLNYCLEELRSAITD